MATITTFDAFVTACRTAVTPRVVSVALRTDTDYLTFADDGSTCGPTRKTFAVVGTAYGVARPTGWRGIQPGISGSGVRAAAQRRSELHSPELTILHTLPVDSRIGHCHTVNTESGNGPTTTRTILREPS